MRRITKDKPGDLLPLLNSRGGAAFCSRFMASSKRELVSIDSSPGEQKPADWTQHCQKILAEPRPMNLGADSQLHKHADSLCEKHLVVYQETQVP